VKSGLWALGLGFGLWALGLVSMAGAQAPAVLENDFNPPVVHAVKTAGDLPLRNIVIEFKK
jgi:hypothetical protein